MWVTNTTRLREVQCFSASCLLHTGTQAPALQPHLPWDGTGRQGWGEWVSVVSLWPTRMTQRSSLCRSDSGARGSQLHKSSTELNKRSVQATDAGCRTSAAATCTTCALLPHSGLTWCSESVLQRSCWAKDTACNLIMFVDPGHIYISIYIYLKSIYFIWPVYQ